MARSMPRPCCHPGCGLLVRDASRCPKHQAMYEKVKEQYRATYGGTARDRGYDHAWRTLKDATLASQPLCHCGRPAQMVHHRVSVRDAPELRLDASNLEALCWRCHNMTHHGRKDVPRGPTP